MKITLNTNGILHVLWTNGQIEIDKLSDKGEVLEAFAFEGDHFRQIQLFSTILHLLASQANQSYALGVEVVK